MASGSLSAPSLAHPFASGETAGTPPPSSLLESANHPLLSHHLVMKNERHHHQHRLYQPYNHLPLHHHHHQQQHLLENHYDLQHYPASTSNAVLGTESRCSSVSSSGADHLTLKSEQPQQSSSLETSSLELLDNANVSRRIPYPLTQVTSELIRQLSYGEDPQRHSSSAGDHLDLHHNGPSSSSASSSSSLGNNNNNNNNKPSGSSMANMAFSSDQIACVCEALQQAGDMEVRLKFHFMFFSKCTICFWLFSVCRDFCGLFRRRNWAATPAASRCSAPGCRSPSTAATTANSTTCSSRTLSVRNTTKSCRTFGTALTTR